MKGARDVLSLYPSVVDKWNSIIEIQYQHPKAAQWLTLCWYDEIFIFRQPTAPFVWFVPESCPVITILAMIEMDWNRIMLHMMASSKWKHFPRYWPFVRGIHRSQVNSSHKCQWRGALMVSSISAWINGWVNSGEADDLRRHILLCRSFYWHVKFHCKKLVFLSHLWYESRSWQKVPPQTNNIT